MKDSWLNPDGEIIELGENICHEEYAIDYLKKEVGIEEYYKQNLHFNAYRELHRRGWIRIQINTNKYQKVRIIGDFVDLEIPMRNTIDPAMNERQLRVAKELCEKYETEFHVAINDKRFW
jgi:hypothetical protein